MKRVLSALGLAMLTVTAKAASVDIARGQLADTPPFSSQPLAITNNTDAEIEMLQVECGFFRGSALLATGVAVAQHILPHQTAYVSVVATHAKGSDKVDCRVVR